MARPNKDLEALKRQLDELGDTIADLTRDTVEVGRKKGSQHLEDLEDQFHTLSKLFLEHGGVASRKAREAGRKAVEYTKENPWAVIGIATAIGLLIGLAMRGNEDQWEDQ